MTQPCKGASIYFIFHHKNSSCKSAKFPGCGGGEHRQGQGGREKCLMAPPPTLPMPLLRVCRFPSLVSTREEGLRDPRGPASAAAASVSVGECP